MPIGISRRDFYSILVYTTKILIVSIPIGKEKEGGRKSIGTIGIKVVIRKII